MEYTDREKQILTLMERTDFKNLSKNDLFSYASKLNELRPEVATKVIAQFPELVKLIQSALAEYRGILDTVVASDDTSLTQVYDIINKDMDHAAASRSEYIDFADKVRSDCSKCLDNPDLTPEQQQEILDREIEILRMVDKKETESRTQEQEDVQLADKKDSEKRMFNWKVIGTASTLVLAAIGIGTAMLGGKFDVKLPIKK
ncbi:MAG: hypothetical protein OSJ58_15335 [Dysosmobacter sp.]|nr:hypothetical protein [Dysosmobacter sp.]